MALVLAGLVLALEAVVLAVVVVVLLLLLLLPEALGPSAPLCQWAAGSRGGPWPRTRVTARQVQWS